MKNWIIISIFFISFSSFSQSEWKEVKLEDYLSFIKSYEKNIPKDDNYYFSTKYEVYSNYSATNPIKSTIGFLLCKNGIFYYSVQGVNFTVQDTVLKVAVDKIKKRIVIQSVDSIDLRKGEIHNYTKLAKYSDRILKKEEGSKIWYNIKLNDKLSIKAIDLIFINKQLRKITIYSKQPYLITNDSHQQENAKFVIEFDDFKKGKSVNLDRFKTVSECIKIKNNQIYPTDIYKDFKIIDLRNTFNQ